MTRRKRRALLGVACATLALLAGCSDDEASVSPGEVYVPPELSELVGTEEVDWAEVDVPPEVLVPPRAPNRNVELQQEAARIFTFCDGWGIIRGRRQPDPYDVDELVNWATLGHAQARLVDIAEPFPNTRRLGGGEADRIEVPREVQDAFAVAERELYSLSARLMWAKNLLGQKVLTEAQFHRRVDLAFLHFASADFSLAERTIETFYVDKC